MARKRIAGRHGERAAILHLLVRAPKEFIGIDSYDHLVSRICLPGNGLPTILPLSYHSTIKRICVISARLNARLDF